MLYHGTDSYEKFELIKKNGFKSHTYFTPFLDTAICYGGAYIFAVDIDHDNYEIWEVIINEEVPVEKILYAQKFDLELIYYNKQALYNKNKRRLEKEGKTICYDCDGKGEYRDEKFCLRHLQVPGGGSFRTRKDPCIPCKVCNGHGYIKEKE